MSEFEKTIFGFSIIMTIMIITAFLILGIFGFFVYYKIVGYYFLYASMILISISVFGLFLLLCHKVGDFAFKLKGVGIE